jgi:chromosome segregation ATPase
MPTDTNYIIIQLLIGTFACLCISVAYIMFLKHKLTKLKPGKHHTFEYAYDGKTVGKTAPDSEGEEESVEDGMNKLDELSGQQLSLSSQLKDMTSENDRQAFSDSERQRLLEHIEALEASLKESGKRITSMNVQYQQASRDIEKEANKVSSLKRVVDAVDTSNEREESLIEKTQQLSEQLDEKVKEIKKLRINSSLMTKELDDLKADNREAYLLKQSLEEAQQKLKRSEAERETLESNYVDLAENSQSPKELQDELNRLKKEYEMLEQRFISYGNSGAA